MPLGFSSANPKELGTDFVGALRSALEPSLQGFLLRNTLDPKNAMGVKRFSSKRKAALPDGKTA